VQLTQPEHQSLSLSPASAPSGHALILASHADTLELLGDFVTRSGLVPTHPLDDEPVEQAVSRIRPRVAIVDFDHPSATSRRFARLLGVMGARMVLCASMQRTSEARECALKTGALYFPLPITYRDFDMVLRTALLL
jgi:hypothetical protein